MNSQSKILSSPLNQEVLKYMKIKPDATISPYSEDVKTFEEGHEYFFGFNIPNNSKFFLDGYGIITAPDSYEIIAFQFERFDFAFKILYPWKYRNNYTHIKQGLLSNLKLMRACRVSLRYFSNIYGDDDTVIDIRSLGQPWVLSIYFVGDIEQHIIEYYNYRKQYQDKEFI
ncbi:MAG: hypothetical protein V4613_13745 [Bacteroidota bacterium]